jgi:hypothetical protein
MGSCSSNDVQEDVDEILGVVNHGFDIANCIRMMNQRQLDAHYTEYCRRSNDVKTRIKYSRNMAMTYSAFCKLREMDNILENDYHAASNPGTMPFKLTKESYQAMNKM